MGYSREQKLQHLITILSKIEYYSDFYFCKPCIYDRMKITLHKSLAKRDDYLIEYEYTNVIGHLLVVEYDRYCY